MAEGVVIRAEGLGKKYQIGHAAKRERYVALRDVIARGARDFWRKTAGIARGRALLAGDAVEEFWALKDVSFEVTRGEVLGIIGRNGAGKSTLLKILSRITEPSEGRVTITGRVASLLEVGTGFHPELTGRENIYLNGAILGMSRAEVRRKFDEIVHFAEIEKFLDTPVKRYSSGMYVRLAFAVAAHLEPEILVVDEVLAVGDKHFQDKCLGKMQDVTQSGRTVLLVSHNMPLIKSLCSAVIVLAGGSVTFSGCTSDGVEEYLREVPPQAYAVVPLENRTDRSGDGRLRFIDAYVLGPDGAKNILPMGAPARIVVSYFAGEMIRSCDLSIHIEDSYDQSLLRLATRESGMPFQGLHRAGQLVCHIPKLPLLPGRYKLLLAASVPPAFEYLDYISGAAYFKVTEDDVFGTGRIPGYGTFFTECEWQQKPSHREPTLTNDVIISDAES
jgi:lipopolysaccharide transport system ATP-binding protein